MLCRCKLLQLPRFDARFDACLTDGPTASVIRKLSDDPIGKTKISGEYDGSFPQRTRYVLLFSGSQGCVGTGLLVVGAVLPDSAIS